MPLDPRAKRFLDVLAAGKPSRVSDSTVAERRAGLAELLKFGGPAIAVAQRRGAHRAGPGGATGGADLHATPANPRTRPPLRPPSPEPGMVYFHGGGLVAGTAATHDGIARALAAAGGCRIVSVEYRLAPEHPFPAAVEDAEAALRYIARNARDFGIEAARLGVCGDSAGGTLAAAAVQAAGAAGDPALALQLLICPILDQSRSTVSRREFGSGYLIDQGTLDHDLLHYLPAGADPADPRISPLRAKELTARAANGHSHRRIRSGARRGSRLFRAPPARRLPRVLHLPPGYDPPVLRVGKRHSLRTHRFRADRE